MTADEARRIARFARHDRLRLKGLIDRVDQRIFEVAKNGDVLLENAFDFGDEVVSDEQRYEIAEHFRRQGFVVTDSITWCEPSA